MLGQTLRAETRLPDESAIVLATYSAFQKTNTELRLAPPLKPDGYRLKSMPIHGHSCLLIAASNDRGVLYGAFAVLRRIALGEPVAALDEREEPSAPVRWVSQWDNLDGTIERGYGGPSIFFEGGHVAEDLALVGE